VRSGQLMGQPAKFPKSHFYHSPRRSEALCNFYSLPIHERAKSGSIDARALRVCMRRQQHVLPSSGKRRRRPFFLNPQLVTIILERHSEFWLCANVFLLRVANGQVLSFCCSSGQVRVVISNIPSHVRCETFEEELSSLTSFVPFISCEKLAPRGNSDTQAVQVMYENQDLAQQ
jgi:hypothetical protein